jgi:hypothetical protein
VDLLFDDQLLASPSADVSGHFEATIKVPATAHAGSHTARAVCGTGSAAATAGFTVVSQALIAPTTTGKPRNVPRAAPRSNVTWLLSVLLGVVAAVAAVRLWRDSDPQRIELLLPSVDDAKSAADRGVYDLMDAGSTGRNPGPGRR